MSGLGALILGVGKGFEKRKADAKADRKDKLEEGRQKLAQAVTLASLLGTPGVVVRNQGAPTAPVAPAAPALPSLESLGADDGTAPAPPMAGDPSATGAAYGPAPTVRPFDRARAAAGVTPPPAAPAGPRIVDLARLATGGSDVDLGFDPSQSETALAMDERTRRHALEDQKRQRDDEAHAGQQNAYELLHRQAPHDYPAFVPGFDYAAEVRSFADDVRTGRRDAASDARREGYQDRRDARERLRNEAESAAFAAMQGGSSPEAAIAEVNKDPRYRGRVTLTRAVTLAREARLASPRGRGTATNDPRWKERRDGFEKKLGTPTTDLQQTILDELANGTDPESVLEQLGADARGRVVAADGDPQNIAEAYRYLRIVLAGRPTPARPATPTR